jgi:hypothetical protein
MEAWKHAFRCGFAPVLPRAGLERLRDLLRADSGELIQGDTTAPRWWPGVEDWPAQGACLVGQCGIAVGRRTVDEVAFYFTDVCKLVDATYGCAAHLLIWYDVTPRDEMVPKLLAEVERALRLGIHAREASHVQGTDGADEPALVPAGV